MNTGFLRWGLTGLVAATALAVCPAAFAQDDFEDDPMQDEVMKLPEGSKGSIGPDHDQVVGRFGVGFMGRRDVAIATPALLPAGAGQPIDVEGGRATVNTQAPVIGVRYWLSEMLGIDAGIGLGFRGGSLDVNDPTDPMRSDDIQGFTTFILHGGVPLALVNEGHFSFQVVPELNVGIARSDTNFGVAKVDLEGTHFDFGARAGAEIHFGFIDVPQLALQAGVGLRFALDKTRATLQTDPSQSSEASTFEFGTSVGSNPWNIFTTNVAALYYF